MYGRAWSNPQLGNKKKSCSEGRQGRNEPSEWMRLLHPHVKDTGEVVGYILFSRWKDLCLVCGKQELEG